MALPPGYSGSSLSPPVLTGDRAHQVQQIHDWILARLTAYQFPEPAKWAESYVDYASKHPGLSAGAAYVGWFLGPGNLTKRLASALQAGLNVGDRIVNAIPSAIQTLSPSQLLGHIWADLTSKNLWLRVAEIVVGVLLLGIGLNAALKATTGQSAGTLAKKVPKVVPI